MADIYVFSPTEEDNDYSTMGLVGALMPTECTFKEVANGESEVTLTHPLDPYEKYRALKNGCILVVPVPVRATPEIQNGSQVTTIWTYKVKPLSQLTNKKQRTLYKKQKGSGRIKIMNEGDTVTVVSKSTTDDAARWKVKSQYGIGYIDPNGFDLVTEHVVGDNASAIEEVQPAWSVTNQLFRIYEVNKSLTEVSVTARHISYDLLYNMTTYVSEDSVSLQTVLDGVFGNCYSAHDFKAFTNVSNQQAGLNYRDKNPIDALFDPEEGILAKFSVNLVRNNFELYVLNDPGLNRGVAVRYAKNMTGVDLTTSDDEVATLVIPVGEKKNGDPLYLSDTVSERGIRNPNPTNEYPIEHVFLLECENCKVGEKDSGGGKVTEEIAKARMREQAQKLFTDGHVDQPKVEMKVEFVNLGDTEEYKQFHDLENCFLFDYVSIVYPAQNIAELTQVLGVEWDCLLSRMKSIEIGSTGLTLSNMGICTWQIPSGINGSKIANGTLYGNKIVAGSIEAQHIAAEAIEASHIKANTIAAHHIAAGQITANHIMANALDTLILSAVSARIAELVADQITTDELYANIAEIGKAQINTANIVSANIDWASINTLATRIAEVCFASIGDANITSANIEYLRAGLAKIMNARISALDAETADVNKLYADTARMLTAVISDANIDTAKIGTLSAEIANMVSVSAKLASYDFASVQALLANALQVDRVNGDLMTIRNLLVNSASMVNAVIGDLVVKASNGRYYRIDIGNDGTLNSMDVTSNLTPSEIAAAETTDGRKIVETDLTVTDLEAENIGAASAMITKIVTSSLEAGAITAGEALIGSATIPTLYTTVIKAIGDTLDLSANNSVRITAGSGAAGDVKTIIDANKDDIVLAAKTATVNDLDLGGTNMVRLKEGTVTVTTGGIIDTTHDYWYTRSRKYLRMAAYTGGFNQLRFDSQIPIVEGKEYVVSFNAWCFGMTAEERAAIILRVNLQADGDSVGVTYDRITGLTSLPERYKVPFTAEASGNLALRFFVNEHWASGHLDITDVKLEEGLVPSKWSPNPLDIEDRMSSAELKITDEAIVGTVRGSADYINDLGAKADASALKSYSTLKQTADSITAAVEDMRYGAVNLARLGTNLVTVQTGSVLTTTENKWYLRSGKYLRMTAFSGEYNVVRFNSPIPIHPATYTLSFKAWTYNVPEEERGNIVLRCNLYGGPAPAHNIYFKDITGLREGAPTRYTATFTAPSDLNEDMVLRFVTFTKWTAGQLEITDVMFEQGTLASEWSPSPMDVDARLSAAELKITDDEIVATVRRSSQYIADMNAKADASVVSQVQQQITADAIVNKVTSSETYQNLLSTVNGKANASDVQNTLANYALTSALTQTAKDIRAEVNAVYSGSANLLRLAEGLVTITTGSVVNAPNTDNYWYLRSRKYLRMTAFTGTYNVLRFNSKIPIVKGKEYTVSFNAWTYQISDDAEREAIILRVNLTTEGDGTGVTYDRISGFKERKPERYTSTFKVTQESDIMALRFITNERWTATAGRLEITDVKLEEGNKATGWSPHPEEFRSGSAIEIDSDHIRMTSGEIDFYGSEQAAAQEDAIVQITDDGMSATSVTAPDVMPVYTGDDALYARKPGDLVAIFNQLSNKVITRNISITVSTDQTGNATLVGALGGAQITVNGNDHTLSGQLSLIRCTVYPTFTRLKVAVRGASALRQYGAFYAQYNSCSFETVGSVSSGNAFVADLMHGARAFFNVCEFLSYSGLALLSLNYGTDGTMFNCTGGTTGAFLRTAGCTFKGSGTRPIGSHTGANTSVLVPSSPASLTTAAGSYNGSTPSPSTGVVTTASFTPTHRRSYGGGSWTEDSSNLLRHGIMSGKSHVGCMWFDLSSLVGKTLTGATLTLSRNAAGPARADVWLKTIDLAYGSGMSNPNSAQVLWVANPEAAIGEVVRKQESSFDLDKDALAGLISNPGTNVAALMLYCTDTEAMGSHSYSSNYASYDGVTLTVSYK